MLYIFEDNEAVHQGQKSDYGTRVQDTQSTFDWLFDRINLDPKISTKYADTKNQLADILTKGCEIPTPSLKITWMLTNYQM